MTPNLLLFSLVPLCLALGGRHISDNAVAFEGIPYARQPVGIHRFEESVPAPFPDKLHPNWKRCINDQLEPGRGEDCLYLSIFRDKDTQKKTKTLLIVTNEELDDGKVAGLVSSQLNVIVASAREGVLSAFGGAPYGVSDIVSLMAFIDENSEQLLVGDVTIWAEGFLAEAVAAAQPKIDIKGVILINGYATSRTLEREKYAARATYKLRTETECDLPSFDQSVDCLRSKPIEELLAKSHQVVKSFSPFGSPYRSPRGYLPEKTVPTILGVYGTLPGDYPGEHNFESSYNAKEFKKFLAALVPDSAHRNAPLLRRMILHQYIYTQGDKKNTYFLFQKSRAILHDRDFRVPVQKVIDHYVRFKNKLWVLEYSIDSAYPGCLRSGENDQFPGFCERLLQYFTRFASLGAPTADSCDPKNPTFPQMGTSKRPYFVELKADGQPEWSFEFHKPAVELWDNLLPSLDTLELAGRRDAQFEEEREVDPLEVEDDIQVWHERAVDDDTELTEEKALNDMPHKQEL